MDLSSDESCDDFVDLPVSKPNCSSSTSSFACGQCSSVFQYERNLKKHSRKCGQSARAHRKCYVTGCSRKFYHETKLLAHLERDHSAAICDSEMRFTCMGDFLEWKEREQAGKFAYLAQQTGTTKIGKTKYTYFVCQHDGSKKCHGK